MGYVDVLIPGVIGLLMVAAPNLFIRVTGDVAVDAPRQTKFRTIGFVLLGVAILRLFSELASPG